MAATLMSIGLSVSVRHSFQRLLQVDFTAHISYHYQVIFFSGNTFFPQLTNRKELRDGKIVKVAIRGWQSKLEHTMQSVAWPMVQAGTSTVMCVLPLAFLQVIKDAIFC
jgi:hypothetical protein